MSCTFFSFTPSNIYLTFNPYHFYMNHLNGKTSPLVLFRSLIWELKYFLPLKSRNIMTSRIEALWEQLPLLAFKHYITQQLHCFLWHWLFPTSNTDKWLQRPESVLVKFDREMSLWRDPCSGLLAAWLLMQWTVRLCFNPKQPT